MISQYPQEYPWLFDRIAQIYQSCGEALPPGCETAPATCSLGRENLSY
ncbi:MAG: hypothetical protein HC941_04430 [Microcoleus sp. SU_5_3]|nr:hypothetical protein [Microcoleus sp. SU_5_3]